MRAHLPRLIGVASATLFFVTAGSAQAQGKGHGRGREKAHATAEIDERHHEADRSQYDPRYDHSRYDPRYDDRRNGRRIPPGLAKKPGGMPPGQYKKMYSADQGAGVLRDVLGRRGYPVIRSHDAGDSEHVYYRNRDGSIGHAIVSQGTDRLRFTNVPNTLLGEVLARLY